MSETDPKGATVIVHRRVDGRCELLLLHRAPYGEDDKGDWAWTPPSGVHEPGESILESAIRELREETGLVEEIQPTHCGTDGWCVYSLEVTGEPVVTLSAEHDRYEWVDIHQAVGRCQPRVVSDQLDCFRQSLTLR